MFPMRWLASAIDDDAGPKAVVPRRIRNSRREVHRVRNASQDPGRVIDEPDELPVVGLSAQVDHARQRTMVVLQGADLDERDTPAQVIDHLLERFNGPLLARKVVLAAGVDQPKGSSVAGGFFDLIHPTPLSVA